MTSKLTKSPVKAAKGERGGIAITKSDDSFQETEGDEISESESIVSETEGSRKRM